MSRTIRGKFLLGFLIIFSVSLLLLNFFVVRIIETSNEKIISEDLISLKKNSHVYVKQAFMLNHYSHDEIYFQQMANELVEELQRVTSSEISAYTVHGDLIYAPNHATVLASAKDDLNQALRGNTAYTLSYENGLEEVYFSYPVVVEGKNVGVLRFVKDFSYLYEQSKHIVNFISYVTIAIFAVAFIFSYVLSRNITIPIVKLTKASSEVAGGNMNINPIVYKRKDEIGQLADNFSIMIDKIKRQIERIEKDRDRLEELNLQRKQFFDNVTHELKTPLTSILGYAEMIKDNGWNDKPFFNKGMNHIVDESKRLHGMVLDLLELSSKETSEEVEFERVEVGQVIQDVCAGMAFKAERYKKTIHCEVEPGLIVYGSAPKLRQLFINVIDNAIKYGFPHSAILVTARLTSNDVQVIITNQGDEISSEDVSKIFEPFYRADGGKSQEIGSRGLGLSICRAIVEDHQGKIRIQSANHETSVLIKLPYMDSMRGYTE